MLVVALAAFLASRYASNDGFRSIISPAESYTISSGVLPAALPPNARILDNLQRFFVGQIEAPEHYAFAPNGDIYFGAADGRVTRTKLVGSELAPLETVLYTGDPELAPAHAPCGSIASEPLCGRPLGMAFAPDDPSKLLVADCTRGLMEVDVVARTKRVLLASVAGSPILFANSLTLSSNGDKVYFTDSSSRWTRENFIYEVLQSTPTGRLIEFDRRTHEARVIVTNVAFSNGLLLNYAATTPVPASGDKSAKVAASSSPSSPYLILVELNRARLLRVDLSKPIDAPIDWRLAQHQAPGSSASPVSILIDNLPGIPDNLAWEEDDASRSWDRRRFWVGCGTARKAPFSLTDSLAPYPAIREALAWVLPKQAFLRLVPRVGLLLRLEVEASHSTARIVESMQDNSGGIMLLTGAYEHGGYLFVGAIAHEVNYVARIPYSKANKTDTTYLLSPTVKAN